ncbi:hypothetical protein PG637_10050 [Riemerella anatipestifer]|nr:hypothetical protein [Riemerella anatipestifer]MDY3326008.1 hypothetical protein [Riemerella anatipestifer]MDY3352443.1 hypothetical protein [Riemerella anatipestifer]
MKNKILLVLLVLANELYSQKDTVVINQQDIKIKQEQVYHLKHPRGGYNFVKEYRLKKTNELLNGFYKVIVDENYFYTLYFENGIKVLKTAPYLNIVRYYQNDSIHKIEVFYPASITTLYYHSIENFDCKAKRLIGYKRNIYDDATKSTFKIKQKITKDSIKWCFKGDDEKGKIFFSKNGGCEK